MTRSGTYPRIDGPGLRKPQLRARNPVLLACEEEAAKVFDLWMRVFGHTNTEIADRFGVTEKIVRELRDREKPLHVGHLVALDEADFHQVMTLLRVAKTEFDARAVRVA